MIRLKGEKQMKMLRKMAVVAVTCFGVSAMAMKMSEAEGPNGLRVVPFDYEKHGQGVLAVYKSARGTGFHASSDVTSLIDINNADVAIKRGYGPQMGYVLLLNDEVIGVITYRDSDFKNSRYIESLVIAKKYRGSPAKYGKFLIDFLEKKSLAEGVEEIALDATPRSIGFYEKLGYKTPEIRKYSERPPELFRVKKI
jgi:ribosomal protein S18 acetylase RimI-like enzyme